MDFFEDRVGIVEEQLALVVVTDLYVMTVLDAACPCHKIAHQHLKQCGLADTVGTYYADSLTALDVKIYIFEKFLGPRSIAECLAEIFCVYDVLAALEVFLEAELHLAVACTRLFCQFHSREAFFSRCSSLGQLFCTVLLEATDHLFLTIYLLLLLLVLSQLRFTAIFSLHRIEAVASFVYIQLVIIDFKYPVDRLIQEVSVVRYYYDSSLVVFQILFQPLESSDVQMVGRFVKEQDVRFSEEQTRQRQPRSFAAGKSRYLLVVAVFLERHATEHTCYLAFVCISAQILVSFVEGVVPFEKLMVFYVFFDLLEKSLHLTFHLREVTKDSFYLFYDSLLRIESTVLLQISDLSIRCNEEFT